MAKPAPSLVDRVAMRTSRFCGGRAKTQDVNMLVNMGGRERTEDEYRALYAAAGLDLTRTIPAQGELHILEGVPS